METFRLPPRKRHCFFSQLGNSGWRPPFITALAAEDRCHLNGLAIVDGRPGFVTALGTTDTRDGWRANKPHGGCILDVATGEIITRGLSPPRLAAFRRRA